jgi:hypothetical protein
MIVSPRADYLCLSLFDPFVVGIFVESIASHARSIDKPKRSQRSL